MLYPQYLSLTNFLLFLNSRYGWTELTNRTMRRAFGPSQSHAFFLTLSLPFCTEGWASFTGSGHFLVSFLFHPWLRSPSCFCFLKCFSFIHFFHILSCFSKSFHSFLHFIIKKTFNLENSTVFSAYFNNFIFFLPVQIFKSTWSLSFLHIRDRSISPSVFITFHSDKDFYFYSFFWQAFLTIVYLHIC